MRSLYSTGAFYNRISFMYPIIDQFLKRQKKVLIDEINMCPSGRVLEIGVGDGSHLPLYGSHHITAIDISEAMLHKARRFESDTINLLLMNGEDMHFEHGSFDYVVISHAIAVVKDPDKLLEEVYKVMKPGGKLFILNHFTPDNWLKYIDRAFQPISSLLHLRSAFYPSSINGLKKFHLLKQTELGTGSYFKLLILSRP